MKINSLRLILTGWSGGAKFQCRGVLPIWIILGQGPTTLAAGAGECCMDIFSRLPFCKIVSPSPARPP